MTLLAPFFAYLLPLALLPVVFHLFLKIRKQPRPFSSLLFFLAADPRHSARRRLRNWLVLLLRTLALAAFFLALARPMKPGWGGHDTRVILVIDNSASMSASDDDGQTRLSRALAAAAVVTQDSQVHQAAILTLAHDPAIALPEEFGDDLSAIRVALGSIRTTHACGDAAGVLRQASSMARKVLRGEPEIHVFSDLHPAAWGAAVSAVEFPRGVAVIVHQVGRETDHSGSVSLMPASHGRRLLAGRPWRLDVPARNYRARECDVTLNVSIEGNQLRQVATVGGNQMKTIRVLPPALPVGEHMIHLWLDGPMAGPSAEAWQVIRVEPPDDVWLLGSSSEYGMLEMALDPVAGGGLTGLRVSAVPIARIPITLPTKLPVLVVASFGFLTDPHVSAFCRDYVTAGGTLLISPGSGSRDGTPHLPSWCGLNPLKRLDFDPGAPLIVMDPEASLWDDLRDDQGQVILKGITVIHGFGLEFNGSPAPKILAGTSNGNALLAQRVLGRGMFYVAGFGWDTQWSNLPRRAPFLPLALGFAKAAVPDASPAIDMMAGTPFPSEYRLQNSDAPIQIRTVAGDVLKWDGHSGDLVTPARAGVFCVEGLGKPMTVAVFGAPDEAEQGLVRNPSVLAGVEYLNLVYRSAEGTAADIKQARRGHSLFGLFIMLAGVFWMLELVLANLKPVKLKEGSMRPESRFNEWLG